eukprot:g17112.t1
MSAPLRLTTEATPDVRRSFFSTLAGGKQGHRAVVEDYFAILELPRKYFLTPQELDTAFREVQKRCHPDKIAAALGGQDAAEAAAKAKELELLSTKANEAVRVLRSPLERAKYWLLLHGVEVLQEGQRIGDNALLMEMMEKYEELEELEAGGEDGRNSSMNILGALKKENDSAIALAVAEIDMLISSEELQKVQGAIEKLALLYRFAEKIRATEDRLGAEA